MKRIGIITLYDNFNYGNRLQNYALSCFINKILNKFITDTICYKEKNNNRIKKFDNIYRLKNIRKYLFNRGNYKTDFLKHLILHDIIREYNIKKFSDKYINLFLITK